jgi:hypothetical protein
VPSLCRHPVNGMRQSWAPAMDQDLLYTDEVSPHAIEILGKDLSSVKGSRRVCMRAGEVVRAQPASPWLQE